MRSGIGRSLRPIVFGCVLREGVRLRVAAIAGQIVLRRRNRRTVASGIPRASAVPCILSGTLSGCLQGYRIPLIAAGRGIGLIAQTDLDLAENGQDLRDHAGTVRSHDKAAGSRRAAQLFLVRLVLIPQASHQPPEAN